MSSSNSPITGIIEEDQVILDFGKYKGKTVAQIAELDRPFYEKLVSEKESGTFSIRRMPDKTFQLHLNPLSKMNH